MTNDHFPWPYPMMIPPRIRRHARDRALAVIFAVIFGVSLGIGAWYIWYRDHHLQSPQVAQTKPQKPNETTHNAPLKQKQTPGITQSLAPHKALYQISLISAKSSSPVIDITGKMYFKVEKTCDAFETNHRFILSYSYADSPSMRMTSDFATRETLDHQGFTFSSSRYQDNELFQEVAGNASLAPQGLATYQAPANVTFALDDGTMFPTAHTQLLIDAARKGKKFMTATVFDGTDDKGPVEITALIGATIPHPSVVQAAAGVDKELLNSRAWKIRLAFFPLNDGGDSADYELSMILHENGVISDMAIDYTDFSVKQKLLALEAIPTSSCPSQGAKSR